MRGIDGAGIRVPALLALFRTRRLYHIHSRSQTTLVQRDLHKYAAFPAQLRTNHLERIDAVSCAPYSAGRAHASRSVVLLRWTCELTALSCPLGMDA